MKKLTLSLLAAAIFLQSSCVPMLKTATKLGVRKYDDLKEVNVSDYALKDADGKTYRYSELFKGQTVYLYTWFNANQLPPTEEKSNYAALKQRFEIYPDVAFAYLFTGPSTSEFNDFSKKHPEAKSFMLVKNDQTKAFLPSENIHSKAQIIGKDGTVLGYNGPGENDNFLVDYALMKARDGQDAKKSAHRLIKSVNRDGVDSEELKTFYAKHFHKPADSTNFSIHFGN